jgi:hypothetical protein
VLSTDVVGLIEAKIEERRDEEGRKKWFCVECGFWRASKWDVKRHVEQKHLGLTVQCTYCPAVYTRRDKLKAHLKNVHSVQ